MVKMKLLGAAMLLGLATGCTAVQDVKQAKPQGSPFTVALANEYRDLAVFESDEMFDHIDAAHFARKGLSAAQGNVVTPADPDEWSLPREFAPEAKAARERLMKALEGGRAANPAVAARAQVKYDCWIEQNEENFQFDHIAACRDEFFLALRQMEAPRAAAAVAGDALTFICFFDFNSAVVDAECRETVSLLKGEAAKRTAPRIEIVGHTDTSGTPVYNMALSLRRADNVLAEMGRQGIARQNVSASAKGEESLRVKTADGVRERENRRVEITLR